MAASSAARVFSGAGGGPARCAEMMTPPTGGESLRTEYDRQRLHPRKGSPREEKQQAVDHHTRFTEDFSEVSLARHIGNSNKMRPKAYTANSTHIRTQITAEIRAASQTGGCSVR